MEFRKLNMIKGLSVYPVEQWSSIFLQDYNWHTFYFIKAEIEDDRMLGAISGSIYLLGLGIDFRWVYTVTEQMEDIKKQVKEIKRELGEEEPH